MPLCKGLGKKGEAMSGSDIEIPPNSIAYRPWRGYNILINTEDVNEKEENNVYNLFYIAYYNYMRCSEYK